jgi:DNA-binding LytR/AlgR family response regulator
MDRLSLKSVESMLESNAIQFSRVHKSFLINPTYVKEVSGRSQSYKIEMLHTNAEIPVSRKFDVSLFDN